MPRAKARRQWTVADYDRAALSYSRRLPLEHFMEGIPQSTQRKITLESLDLLLPRIQGLQLFNELLIQYFHKGRLRRVVPDNMLRRSNRQTVTETSYNLELEGAPPFLVLEYVSPTSHRKDYGESFQKYEQELQVPYCLMYYPDRQDLRVYRLVGEKYEQLAPNTLGRYAIPELELEVAIVNGWVRFWHQGRLLPLPQELENQVLQERQHAEHETQRAEHEKQRAEQAETELSRLRELLAQLKPVESKP